MAADATGFRIYRSGLGYTGTDPGHFRFIGEILANSTSTVTYVDLNANIPGSDTIFLLDMEEGDNAIDFR